MSTGQNIFKKLQNQNSIDFLEKFEKDADLLTSFINANYPTEFLLSFYGHILDECLIKWEWNTDRTKVNIKSPYLYGKEISNICYASLKYLDTFILDDEAVNLRIYYTICYFYYSNLCLTDMENIKFTCHPDHFGEKIEFVILDIGGEWIAFKNDCGKDNNFSLFHINDIFGTTENSQIYFRDLFVDYEWMEDQVSLAYNILNRKNKKCCQPPETEAE